MSKINYVALAGLFTSLLLISGCDKPRDEPITGRPNLSQENQQMTYGGPAEVRSQFEYVQQMEEFLLDEPDAYAAGTNDEASAGIGFQEWDHGW